MGSIISKGSDTVAKLSRWARVITAVGRCAVIDMPMAFKGGVDALISALKAIQDDDVEATLEQAYAFESALDSMDCLVDPLDEIDDLTPNKPEAVKTVLSAIKDVVKATTVIGSFGAGGLV